jgi:glycosyltransferase involved in cell wall biosynthesis
MRLHLLAVPHTVTTPEWSHCAFTQKVRRMVPMMRAQGFDIVHYGTAGAEVNATEHVDVMTQGEVEALLGHPLDPHARTFFGDDATAGSPLYRQWNQNARDAMRERVAPGDLILCPFGWAHDAAVRGLPVLAEGAAAIESGIGYFDCLLPWRIYESYAVRHAVMAKEGRHGVQLDGPRIEAVVPNYYDLDEWPQGPGGAPVVFMGRLTEGKGVPVVLEMARRRPDVPFVLAGQGDPLAFGELPANVQYVGPVIGAQRAHLLGHARAVVAPSRYVEPFGGVVIEAALCGTPAITSDFGCFSETVLHGLTGLRCAWMQDFVDAIDEVLTLDRRHVRRRARALYSLERVGRQYAHVFRRASVGALAGQFPHAGW